MARQVPGDDAKVDRRRNNIDASLFISYLGTRGFTLARQDDKVRAIIGPKEDVVSHACEIEGELIGIKKFTFAGVVVATQPMLTKATGYLMAKALEDIMPFWAARKDWLNTELGRLGKLPKKTAKTKVGGWSVELVFRPSIAQVVLTICPGT